MAAGLSSMNTVHDVAILTTIHANLPATVLSRLDKHDCECRLSKLAVWKAVLRSLDFIRAYFSSVILICSDVVVWQGRSRRMTFV